MSSPNDTTLTAPAELAPEAAAPRQGSGLDLAKLQGYLKIPAVQAGLLILAMLIGIFWTLTSQLPGIWFDSNGYYQHAVLVPFAAGYIVWAKWSKLNRYPIRPTFWPLIFLLPILYVSIVASRSDMMTVTAVGLLTTIGLVTWMMLGFRWTLMLTPVILFISLALPLWGPTIDKNTLDLQIFSTDGAYFMLEAVGLRPFREAPTIIQLPQYSLNIAAACSGMKMTLAMISCVAFMVLSGGMKWWGSVLLCVLAVPLSVIMNSLRITLIGIFGNASGPDAGMWMHDYGSYGILALSFYIVYKIATALGWKI